MEAVLHGRAAGDVTDRLRLAATFDRAAEVYERGRPGYPDELIDPVVDLAGLRPGDRLLEIGCATGTATASFAERGFAVTCVEPGARLVDVARRALARFAAVQVEHAPFETWDRRGRTFDLVVAATAWHWLDPGLRYRLAWDALDEGGHLAFWTATHVFPEGGDPIFDLLERAYDEVGEGLRPGARRTAPGELPEERADIEGSGLFEVVGVRHLDWETVHDADGYVDLLRTFSGHIAMQPWQRDRIFAEVRSLLAERADGLLRRHWGAVVHVARRRS